LHRNWQRVPLPHQQGVMDCGFEWFRFALMRLASDCELAGCPYVVACDDDNMPRIRRCGSAIHQVESSHSFPLVTAFGASRSIRSYFGPHLFNGLAGLSERHDPGNCGIGHWIASVDRRLPAPLVEKKAHSHKLTGVRPLGVRLTMKGRAYESNDLKTYRCG
jgi:hypothetical protein